MYTNASPRAAQQRPPHVWTLYACAVRLRQTPETAQRGLQIGRLVARGTTVRPLLADDAARTGSEPGIQDVRQDSTAAHTRPGYCPTNPLWIAETDAMMASGDYET